MRAMNQEGSTQMRGHIVWGWCLATTIAIAGCGGGGQQSSTTTTETTPPAETTPPPAPAETTAVPAVSPYDDGPRAGASAANAALATTGEGLFKTKGCVTCHAYGKKQVTGPDLRGVTMRRTALWMENQIMHPDVMVKSDPITRSLVVDFKVPMTNMQVTEDQAKALIEFLKREDKKSGAKS
jgi:cytochrome c5